MNKRWFVLGSVLLFLVLFAGQTTITNASTTADCYTASTGGDAPAIDFDFTFTCSSAQKVYFGVCDSGVPDDTFTITYKGSIVSESTSTGTSQTINIGSATSDSGVNTATLNVIAAPDNLSTYSYAVSSSYDEVATYMNTFCGFVIPIPTSIGCNESVPLFTQDAAPSDGTLEFHILLGNEGARVDEQILQTWDLNAGDQINNATVANLGGQRYARVWWQPAGGSDWYMLPSQYYQNGSSTDDEYGITCGNGQPSYHTSFAAAVAESDVCFDLLNGCN